MIAAMHARKPLMEPAHFTSIPVACWWVVVTITTVGYGDAAPLQSGTKLFACFWLAFATLSLGKAVSDLVDYRLAGKVLAIRQLPPVRNWNGNGADVAATPRRQD